MHEAAEEICITVTDMRAIGDKVFVAVTARGRGKLSGVPVEGPIWFVSTFRDGLVVRTENYPDAEQALEAAGLRG